MMNCPKCGFEQPEKNPECPRCGVIFKKYAEKRSPKSGMTDRTAGIDDFGMRIISTFQERRKGFLPYYIIGQALSIAAIIFAIATLPGIKGSRSIPTAYFIFLIMFVTGQAVIFLAAHLTAYRCPACESIVKRKFRYKAGSVILGFPFECPECGVRLAEKKPFWNIF